jgi:hypothetical protein
MAALVREGLEEPLQFSSGQPAVLRRLAGLLRELAWQAPPRVLDDVLRSHLQRVVDLARETTAVDHAETARWERELTDALAGRWAAPA